MQLAASPSPPNPDSPNTPVNVVEHADPKIHNPDSDTVVEPLHVKEELPAPLQQEQYDAPPVEGQTGLVSEEGHQALEQDVNMEEGAAEEAVEEQIMQDEGGEGELDGDVTMDAAVHEGEGHSPPAGSSTTAVDSVVEDEQPPVKRARKHSDADLASAHTTPTATPAAAQTVATLSAAQHKFLLSTIRQLKKLKDAGPFKQPVDPVALGIPHYFQVVKHPMDLQTVERKLASSNPAKPDPNATNPRYTTADELIQDVRQMVINSVTFNGPDHLVTQMGKRVEEQFDKSLKQLPPPEETRAEPSWLSRPSQSASTSARPPKPAPVKKEKIASPSPPAPAPKKAPPPRRPSTSTPTIRRNDDSHRPKREIHAPATKELPYTNEPKKPRRRASKSGASNEQLKYCSKILDHLSKKQYQNTVIYFAEPVDWVKLQIPDYPKIVKKPMDLGTMRIKLDNGEYASADRFRADFNQIIKNCGDYNPKGTAVYDAGQTLKGLFEEKWRNLPPLHPTIESEDDEDADLDDDEEVDRVRRLREMQEQMLALQAQMEEMQGAPAPVVKKPKVAPPPPPPPKKRKAPPVDREPSISAPLPSTSRPKKERAPPPPPPPPKKKAINRKTAVIPDDDVLSFDQKKELSEAIGTLDGGKLERVINIIHEGVPEIRDSQEEIELEIDALPANVLTKLYNFVIRPMKPPPPKKPRTGKGTGTGGLKRKSMDEDVEEAKIRRLEAQMRLFDEHAAGGSSSAPLPPMPVPAAANGHESDSSSDDDSSGSDSE